MDYNCLQKWYVLHYIMGLKQFNSGAAGDENPRGGGTSIWVHPIQGCQNKQATGTFHQLL